MSAIKRLLLLVASFAIAAVTPSLAGATTQGKKAALQQSVPSVRESRRPKWATEREVSEYARREAKARGLANFEGGHARYYHAHYILVPAVVVLFTMLLMVALVV